MTDGPNAKSQTAVEPFEEWLSAVSKEEPLTRYELDALNDIKTYTRDDFYTWKQASMKKLETRGLVRRDGILMGHIVWRLTEKGRSYE